MLLRANTNLITFCKLKKQNGVYVNKVSTWNSILYAGWKESRPRENKGCVKLARKETCSLKTNIFLSNKNDITIEQSQKVISSSHEQPKQFLSVITLFRAEAKQYNGDRFGINVYQKDSTFLFLKRVVFKRGCDIISTDVRIML